MPGRDQPAGDGRIAGGPPDQVEFGPRPYPLPIPAMVIVRAALPAGMEPRRGPVQFGRARRQIFGREHEAFVEDRAFQPQAPGRRRVRDADGDGAPLTTQDRQPCRRQPGTKPGLRLPARPDLPRAGRRLQRLGHSHPGIRLSPDPRPAHFGRPFADEIRQRDKPPPRRVQRVGPAKAPVQQVLQGQPVAQRVLRIPGRMRIVAHHPPVRPDQGPRQCQIDLQPAGMGVRGDVICRTRPARHTGPGQGQDQLQAQVHLAPEHRIAGVEGCAVDVLSREGEHEARIFALEGQDRQRLAQPVVTAAEHLGPGISQDGLARPADVLHHHRRIHVAGQRQVAVRTAQCPVIVMICGEGDQHAGSSASSPSSSDARAPARSEVSILRSASSRDATSQVTKGVDIACRAISSRRLSIPAR